MSDDDKILYDYIKSPNLVVFLHPESGPPIRFVLVVAVASASGLQRQRRRIGFVVLLLAVEAPHESERNQSTVGPT